jgi:biopolymer transport protein ExbD
MSAWRDELINEKVELQIAPLIDVVFLLLIYFMVTSTLKQPEADLGITLPGVLTQSKTMQIPDEQIIEVMADGRVFLNGKDFGENGSKHLSALAQTLARYRMASEAAKNKAMITIQGEDEAVHERIVDVMNACAGAGIKHVTFGMGE